MQQSVHSPQNNNIIISDENAPFYQASPTGLYVIVYTINPVDQVPIWLSTVESWFKPHGISFIYRHPAQAVPLALFENSQGVLLWNGTLPVFTQLKAWLNSHHIAYSFVECGFFPQTQHVYFDKQGINVECSLATDDLRWLPENASALLANKEHEFFDSVLAYCEHEDYIFVPLQLGDDSNIQFNSRFTSGMQPFIDYIENLYPSENIVFKAHPRDNNTYSSALATSYWSDACAKSLIKGAKKVHGINSTVLFEAELWGVETIIEGDCLLSRHKLQKRALLEAIVCYQHDLKGPAPDIECILDKTYIRLD